MLSHYVLQQKLIDRVGIVKKKRNKISQQFYAIKFKNLKIIFQKKINFRNIRKEKIWMNINHESKYTLI